MFKTVPLSRSYPVYQEDDSLGKGDFSLHYLKNCFHFFHQLAQGLLRQAHSLPISRILEQCMCCYSLSSQKGWRSLDWLYGPSTVTCTCCNVDSVMAWHFNTCLKVNIRWCKENLSFIFLSFPLLFYFLQKCPHRELTSRGWVKRSISEDSICS